jgi:hypothetical protein
VTRSMTDRRAVRLAVAAAAVALAVTGCSAGQIAETALKQASVSGVTADTADQKLAVRGLAVAYEGVEGYPAGASAPLEVALINQTRDPITVLIGVAPADGSDPTMTAARQVVLTTGAEAAPSPSGQASASPSGSPAGSASPQASGSPEGEAAAPNTSGAASPEASGNAAQPNAGTSGSPDASGAPVPSPVVPPAAPAGQPAQITIPASGAVTFTPESAQRLALVGLAGALRSGMAVTLTFQVTQGGEQSPLLTVKTPVAIPLTPAPRQTGEAEEHHE